MAGCWPSTPSNTFLVGRIKRNVSTSSWIGAVMTNRDSTRAGDYNRVVGADAHFQFVRKLDFDAYLLGSETPGRTGRNQARRLQAAWTDEELVATAEYNEVQPNVNPEVGFIRRRDMQQYSGDIAWRPQLPQSDLIRNFNVGTAIDYFEGSGSGQIETRVTDTTFSIVFESNASASVVVNNTFDRLNSPLAIPSGNPHVTIPVGDYTFDRYTGQFTTNQRKKIIRGFSPRAFLNAFLQYNADTHLISFNIRFDLIHRPLSDLYIVYNDTRDTALGQVRERAFVVKLTNLFTF